MNSHPFKSCINQHREGGDYFLFPYISDRGSTPQRIIYEKPPSVQIETKYQLWNLGQSGLVVLNNDGTVDCKGTFGAAGST